MQGSFLPCSDLLVEHDNPIISLVSCQPRSYPTCNIVTQFSHPTYCFAKDLSTIKMPNPRRQFPRLPNDRLLLYSIPCGVLIGLILSDPHTLLIRLPGRSPPPPPATSSDSSVPVSADDVDSHDKKYADEIYGPGRPR